MKKTNEAKRQWKSLGRMLVTTLSGIMCLFMLIWVVISGVMMTWLGSIYESDGMMSLSIISTLLLIINLGHSYVQSMNKTDVYEEYIIHNKFRDDYQEYKDRYYRGEVD